jgi:hypothetical protein
MLTCALFFILFVYQEVIKKMAKVKALQKARVQNLKTRLKDLENTADPSSASGSQQRAENADPADDQESLAADVPDDESVISDYSVSEFLDSSRLSNSSVLTRQFSETR